MRNLFRPAVVVLCVLVLGSVSSGGPVRTANSSTEEFVRFLEDAWVNAIVHKDIKVLDRILADDFGGISPNGYRYTKQEAISDILSGAYLVQSMTLDTVQVRVIGDMAIVTFYQNEQSRFGDENCSGRYAFTDIWVKRDGDWRAVASQGTPIVLP